MLKKCALFFAAAVLLVSGVAPAGAGEEGTAPLVSLFGEQLLNAEGKPVPVESLKAKKLGIYFSAHWCPPCRLFTPKLVAFYKQVNQGDDAFQVVFVSSDRSEEAMLGYMKSANMPWLALPFSAPQKEALARKYGVRGIPTLVIIDDKGHTLSTQGRMEVMVAGKDAYQQW